MSDKWTPSSWREKTVAQDVVYPDQTKLTGVLGKLSQLPPLVTSNEIERLRHQLAEVQRGEAFLLHAGDCAESFEAVTEDNISAKIGLILSFSLIVLWGARTPVVRIGRIAGQYAKPRSSQKEKVTIGGVEKEVNSFRGDNVNGFDPEDRTPNPERLLNAYFHSATTLNCIRSLLTSGFASLHKPREWSFRHVRDAAVRSEFERIVEGLTDAMNFSRTIGVEAGPSFETGGARGSTVGEVDFYTSHEGLLLPYEEALTRPATRGGFYNTSAHFLWIGDRTRQLTGAHVEYFRGIRNAIGVKVGPTMDPEELVRLLDIVNADREAGRVTLITRYGADKIESHLPAHISAVQKSQHPVIWVSDPMHGNTQTSAQTGLKTRQFRSIVSEITSALKIHAESNSKLNGVSLEFTGEMNEDGFSVTECLGGSMELTEEELGLRYQTFCDPRLNFEQSLDVAFIISNWFKAQRKSAAGETDVLYSVLGAKA